MTLFSHWHWPCRLGVDVVIDYANMNHTLFYFGKIEKIIIKVLKKFHLNTVWKFCVCLVVDYVDMCRLDRSIKKASHWLYKSSEMKYILGGVYISNCNKINLENCGLPKAKIYVVTRGVRRIWERGGEFLFRTCGPPPSREGRDPCQCCGACPCLTSSSSSFFAEPAPILSSCLWIQLL